MLSSAFKYGSSVHPGCGSIGIGFALEQDAGNLKTSSDRHKLQRSTTASLRGWGFDISSVFHQKSNHSGAPDFGGHLRWVGLNRLLSKRVRVSPFGTRDQRFKKGKIEGLHSLAVRSIQRSRHGLVALGKVV
ncbi:hypothetical protein MPH_03799 [Macrophomina phaseolina MS6]|uniref:Uncharacterized protein n=1 Tax=Macrophomina phaseolina (strain MS6) TaxID=1126212 RepID=K2SQE2_MACPH|nr:hypothetical protein MPH_03799 [Macrophomina phaseolina MS6]